MKNDFTNSYFTDKKDPDTIAMEIFKGEGKTKQEAIKAGYFNIWTEKRIKGAFNSGNGTMKDFKEYMNNNKQYCWIEILTE